MLSVEIIDSQIVLRHVVCICIWHAGLQIANKATAVYEVIARQANRLLSVQFWFSIIFENEKKSKKNIYWAHRGIYVLLANSNITYAGSLFAVSEASSEVLSETKRGIWRTETEGNGTDASKHTWHIHSTAHITQNKNQFQTLWVHLLETVTTEEYSMKIHSHRYCDSKVQTSIQYYYHALCSWTVEHCIPILVERCKPKIPKYACM